MPAIETERKKVVRISVALSRSRNPMLIRQLSSIKLSEKSAEKVTLDNEK